MSEQYRFMRYYLPGSLLLFYLVLLMVASLSAESLRCILNHDGIIAVFLGFFGASPVIGYLVYAFYDPVYEYLSRYKKRRHALALIEEWAEKKNRTFKSPVQRKEFLDLVYHASSRNGHHDIDQNILETMKNHLSNYSARVICGALVPMIAAIVYFAFIILIAYGIIPQLRLSINWGLWLTFSAIILIASAFLYLGRSRVLRETFALEELLILSRKKEAKKLLESTKEALAETKEPEKA
jgi:hypothetical protein